MNITATLIGQSITFLFFIWFCWKFVWPPLLGVMKEREQKIAHGLADAEHAQKDLKLAKRKAAEQLKEAKDQAGEIIEGANRRASQIIDEAKQAALAEGDRLKVAAKAEIEQEVNRAKEQLRSRVAALSVLGAEKILAVNIDARAQNDLIDKLAAEL
ncbi:MULTISPECIES: F0F1 ATP synthase subunit B [unclassified Microbulbifer]|uniref:ATP synthase subunit b n=1 Tax=Microbulbifer spongiae TaxID=2944933 RepID=A0ABY9EE65_9GAMM|nr:MULTISPECIES: F0F1 ATP synthase subunit B [unclassified Microbulbifer]MDP5210701.1 F0F1 ATP synthase subunit B [Microbulbifer sp. 2205BS26-8]WKD49834.1 F0F1 ATP synthase subunit B [Microbulbifer sp. MI-G]